MSADETCPLYVHRLGSVIHVLLPEEYRSTDLTEWLGIVSEYLDGRGYKVEQHEVARSRISAKPCATLRVCFAPKEHELRHRGHAMEQLHEQLNPKYTLAVHARFARGYAFDEVVGSQVRLIGAPGTVGNIDISKHRDWLRERKVEYHSANGGACCFTLPASYEPEVWQHTLANTFGAFVLKEDVNWH